MKTLWLLCSLLLSPCSALVAGPAFFSGQQGVVATSSAESLTLPTITTGTYVLQLIGDDLTAGSTVTSWSSRVGGWSAAQSTTSKKPSVVAAAIGSRNAVRFDRVDDALSVASFNSGGLSAVTIFIVVKVTTSSGDDIIVESSANYNANNGAFIFYKTSGDKAFLAAQQGGVNNTFQTTTSISGTAYVISCVDDKSLSTDEATLWLDGTSSGTRPLNANLTGTFSTYDLFIGARGGTSLFMGGDIGAIIICSGALDTTDRQAIETALLNWY